MKKKYIFKAINKKTNYCENNTDSEFCRSSNLKKLRDLALDFKRRYNINTSNVNFEAYELSKKDEQDQFFVKTFKF